MFGKGRIAFLLGLALLLAGCSGFGAGTTKAKAVPAKPSFRSFDLYLFPLGQSNGQDTRWELYPGAKVEAWAIAPENDPAKATIPGPEIRVKEGDTVQITFNIAGGAPMAHTLHWHGLHVPWDMDGVPYMSQAPLGDKPWGNGSKVFTYTFTVKDQSGTYWYHCHVDTQHHVDMGMYGPFIVEPANPDQDPHFDTETTLMFDEWDKSHIHSNPQPDQVLARSGQPEDSLDNLYSQLRDYYQMSTLTAVEQSYQQVYEKVQQDPNVPQPVKDFLRENKPSVLRENRTWYPVTYPAYYADYDTFLINGHAFPMTQPVPVAPGTTLRIRMINAGSLPHSIHLHGHHMLVTHKDGYLLPDPYHADTLPIFPGERYDVYVKLDNPGPWMLHDHMAQYEQNDHMSPGGIATVVCYTSGWALANVCQPGNHPGGRAMTAGDVTDALTDYFAATQGAPVDPAFTPGSGHEGMGPGVGTAPTTAGP